MLKHGELHFNRRPPAIVDSMAWSAPVTVISVAEVRPAASGVHISSRSPPIARCSGPATASAARTGSSVATGVSHAPGTSCAIAHGRALQPKDLPITRRVLDDASANAASATHL